METTPAATTSAAPAASGSAAPTTSAAAAQGTSAPINVSNNPPGTSTANQPAEGTGKWFEGYDADTRDYITQKGFQDAKSVVDSYRNLEKLRGVPQDRLLKLPDAQAGADAPEWNDVYTKLGKPAAPEGYGLQAKSEEGKPFTEWAKGAFHKLNLTTAQGQELVKQFNQFSEQQSAAAADAYNKKIQTQTESLKRDWGMAYDQNVGRAQAAYRQLGIPDAAIDSLEQSIGFDGIMKIFHKLGTQMGEHNYVNGGGNQGFGEGAILSPEDAQARIKSLRQDAEFSKKYTQGDVKAKAEMERLHKMAYPT